MHKEIVAVKSYVKRSNLKGAMVNILSMLNMDISLIVPPSESKLQKDLLALLTRNFIDRIYSIRL